MESNSGEMILNNYEKYLGDYSDVKIFSDNKHTIQYLIYDGVFKDCKMLLAFFITKEELEFLKKNGSSKFEDYLSEKECDVFELGRV